VLSRPDEPVREITGLRVDCRDPGPFWLACLEEPVTWGAAPFEADALAFTARSFPARWRVSAAGELGAGALPANGFVVYPLDRTKETPLTVYCLVDVLRNTLGCGPCQYVLDAEGAGPEQQVTPDSVADWVEQQFERGRQARRADQIEERLAAAVLHVQWMAGRLSAYEELSTRVLAVLPERPPLDDPALGRIVRLASRLREDAGMLTYGLEITARAAATAARLNALARADGPAAEASELCGELREVGAAQDRALARCRLTVRRIRLVLSGLRDADVAAAVRAELDDLGTASDAGPGSAAEGGTEK
jgi:hypothetical protein